MLTRQASTARVLLVNDDSFELATMAASLRLHSVNVVGEAPNKFMAENLFRSLEPEAVLIDLQFSGEAAIVLLQKLRNHFATRIFQELDLLHLYNEKILLSLDELHLIEVFSDLIKIQHVYGRAFR